MSKTDLFLTRVQEGKKRKNIQTLITELLAQIPSKSLDVGPADRDKEILRLAIIAEYDAINLYEQMAASATDTKLKKVLLEVAYEEKVHVGEFGTLLEYYQDPEHEKAEEEGKKEVEEI